MTHISYQLMPPLLDAFVAQALGFTEIEIVSIGTASPREVCQVVLRGEDGESHWTEFNPSSDAAVGAPILFEHRIALTPQDRAAAATAGPALYMGEPIAWERYWRAKGPTTLNHVHEEPLVAGCRALVEELLGTEVQPHFTVTKDSAAP